MPHLQENLYMLAMLAMTDTGAGGFAFFRKTCDGSLERSEAFGEPICGATLSKDYVDGSASSGLVVYPLLRRGGAEGALAFTFASKTESDAAQPRLAHHATAIGRLWGVQSLARAYRTTLQRIIDLEEELIQSKISTIVGGALSGNRDSESADAVIRQVETVLRPSNTLRKLEGILETLSVEVHERSWIDQAKEILNTVSGMTEGEAHSYLRKISRRSRRPLADVARQIVQDAEIGEGTNDRR
jgi:hypothetical protein